MNWRRFLRREQEDAELRQELESYLEITTDEYIARGMDPRAARTAARRKLGNGTRVLEDIYEMNTIGFLDSLVRDLRYALRGMRRSPMFTAVAIATLALGIGASAVMFSVVYGVLLKPLHYPEPASLVAAWSNTSISPELYLAYKQQAGVFQHLGIWSNGSATVTGLGDPEQLDVVRVTSGTLDALGVQPALGRWFSDADDSLGSEETVILTHGYWLSRLGGDPSAVGRRIQVDSRPRLIIGVMPDKFEFLNSNGRMFLPQRFDVRQPGVMNDFSYQGIGRLKPGATLEQARAELLGILTLWETEGRIRSGNPNRPTIDPLISDVVGNLNSTLPVLMGTVCLVFLIACANIANLLLVRAEGRQQDFAMRAALGAGWARIAREMLLDSLLLGVLGGLFGLGLAYAAIQLLLASQPALPRLNEIGINPVVAVFTLALSLLAGFLFGLAPIWTYARRGMAGALRVVGRALTHSRERLRVRNAFVVFQVALAFVLLVASGLMIRTFQTLRSIDPGFRDPEQIQLLSVSLPETQVPEPERVMRLQNDMLDQLAAIPGVASVAFGDSVPLGGRNPGNFIFARDKTYAPDEVRPLRRYRFVTPGYIGTLGISLLAGRDFTWADIYNTRPVVLVSENMAREIWGSVGSAVGKQIRPGTSGPWREVIGVVGDVYHRGFYEQAPTMVYWPAMVGEFIADTTRVSRRGTFVIRTERAGTESFLSEARRAIWSVDSELPVFELYTLRNLYDRSMERTRFTLIMLAIAGVMALSLGIVGIYGVIAYSVAERRKEVGIRMALGARPRTVQRMFLANGVVISVIGIVVGLAAAAGFSGLMSSMLFGIAPLDPAAYGIAAVLLFLSASVACYLPARRAAAVDPAETLRGE